MTLAEKRDAIDSLLPAFFTAMVTFQSEMKEHFGRYLQFRPTDPQFEGVIGGLSVTLSVDVYLTGSGAHGWTATATVEDANGDIYQRCQNGAGPETDRTHGWLKINQGI